MWILILGAQVIALGSCRRADSENTGSFAVGKPVTLKILHDALTADYLRQVVNHFQADKPVLSGGRPLVVELLEVPALTAAKGLAFGKFKVDGWLAPSQALVEYVNAHRVNLGAKQVECRRLFGSPYVLATHRDNLLDFGTQAQLSWHHLFQSTQSKASLMHAQPLSSHTGLGSLIQLANLCVDRRGTGLDLEVFNKERGFERLKEKEGFIGSYGEDEQILLRKASERSGPVRRFVLTTEQQMVSFNLATKDTPPPLTAVYLSEGSFWQDYSLCRSEADWVTPDRRVGLKLFSDYLIDPYSQQLVKKSAFRPIRDTVVSDPLTLQYGVRPDLPKRFLPPPAGELTAELFKRWPELQKPAALILVVDLSGSMEGEALARTKQAAIALIEGLSDQDKAALIVFSTQAKILFPLTADRASIIQAIGALQAGGGSALFDALSLGIQMLSQEDLRDYRRQIVVFTDGPDRNSEVSLPLLTAAIENTTTQQDLNLAMIAIAGQELEPAALSEIARAARGFFTMTAASQLVETTVEIGRNL